MEGKGGVELVVTLMILSLVGKSNAKVSLYLSSDQTEALYGIKTDGLYYVREGVVNKYAMNFQHQVTLCLRASVVFLVAVYENRYDGMSRRSCNLRDDTLSIKTCLE